VEQDDLDVSVQRSGWLKKKGVFEIAIPYLKGGGSSTFSRKNWKSRWFVLSDRRLSYSAMVGSPSLGTINIEEIEGIEEAQSKKDEFAFLIHTPKRTYWCISASEDDRKVWLTLLVAHA
jgi:myosin X